MPNKLAGKLSAAIELLTSIQAELEAEDEMNPEKKKAKYLQSSDDERLQIDERDLKLQEEEQ